MLPEILKLLPSDPDNEYVNLSSALASVVCREPTSAPITFSFTEDALREISVGATLVGWGAAGVLDEPPPPQDSRKKRL